MQNQKDQIARALINRLGQVPMSRSSHEQVEDTVKQFFEGLGFVEDTPSKEIVNEQKEE